MTMDKQNVHIQFQDRMVSYDTFIADLAAQIAEQLATIKDGPAYISQRTAYRLYGRGNVTRWVASGKVHPCKRPGKTEYSTAELRKMQRTQQDYFK